jgi:hypothetical protein
MKNKKNNIKKYFIISSILFIIFVTSCSTIGTTINNAIEKNTTDMINEAIDKTSTIYVVKKGDCLWKIAGKKDVYENNFLWPLIFKNNSEQINDPNVIEIGQELKIISLLQTVARGEQEYITKAIEIAQEYKK